MRRLPFNACDYRCERCHVTAECAVYRKLQERSLLHGINGKEADDPAIILEDIRESFRETEQMIKQKAREFGIDLDGIAGRTTAAGIEEETVAGQDSLYKRSEEFMRETNRFLQAADAVIDGEEREYFDDLAWHHTVVPVKIFRALGWRTDMNEIIALDGKNSAAVAVKSLRICIMAFDHLASRHAALAAKCRELSGAAVRIKEDIKERYKLGGRS